MPMTPMTYEELAPWFSWTGECGTYEVPAWNPTNIIRTDQQWGVRFHWTTFGGLNHIMAGNWFLQLLLEKMGPGEGPAIPEKTVTFVSAPHDYNEEIIVAPGTVPVGVYRMVASMTMRGPLNVPGPIAGLWEGPMVNFYAGGPMP